MLKTSEDKNNIHIEEDDMWVYTDRYSLPYLLRHIIIRFDDIALSMESVFEIHYEETPDSVFEYAIRDTDELADDISHLNECNIPFVYIELPTKTVIDDFDVFRNMDSLETLVFDDPIYKDDQEASLKKQEEIEYYQANENLHFQCYVW